MLSLIILVAYTLSIKEKKVINKIFKIFVMGIIIFFLMNNIINSTMDCIIGEQTIFLQNCDRISYIRKGRGRYYITGYDNKNNTHNRQNQTN